MTVRELIAELSKYDPEMIVVVQLDSNELGNGKTVGKVGVADAYQRHTGEFVRDYYPECQGEEWRSDDEPFCKVVNINS